MKTSLPRPSSLFDRRFRKLFIASVFSGVASFSPSPSQAKVTNTPDPYTASDLIARNLHAKGGLDKIRAIHSLQSFGKFEQQSFAAKIGFKKKTPASIRQTFSIQGMNEVQAFDGTTAWKVSPFEGRKDPECLGEDASRTLIEDADFYGPLVEYQTKGHRVEYLGHANVDGDDALKLRVTLKNGDVQYYFLDPDTFLEIRIETQVFIRGSMRESVQDLGAYKKVNGVYFPFSIEVRSKQRGDEGSKITLEKIEANVDLPDSEFKMPASPATSAPGVHR